MNETTPQMTDPLAEISAMTEIAKALQQLDYEAIRRVLSWAADRFGVVMKGPAIQDETAPAPVIDGIDAVDEAMDESSSKFSDIADLYAAANPRNDSEKALVVAYWFQKLCGELDFDSATVNRELRHLGHGISNITSALSNLIAKRPQLVIQTRKSGSSQQARKKYKLTGEGQKVVEQMLRGEV